MKRSIVTKITFFLLFFFVEIALLISTFSFVLRKQTQQTSEFFKVFEEAALVDNLRVALSQAVMPANDFLVYGGEPNEKENFKAITEKVEQLISRMESVSVYSSDEMIFIQHLKNKYLEVKKIGQKIFSMPDALGNFEAGKLMEQMDSVNNLVVKDGEEFQKFVYQKFSVVRADMEHTQRLFNLLIILGFLLNVILIVSGLFYFRRRIVEPIIALRDVVLEIGKGNLDKRVDIRLKDETGELASAFNKMAVDLKQLQEELIQSEKMASLGTMSASIAHELKNPLAIIVQGMEYLQSTASCDADSLEVIKNIKKAVTGMDEIARGLLSFSRQGPLEFEAAEINSLLEETLLMIEHPAKLKNVRIERHLDPGLPRAMVDKNKIKQVFLNIILNAIDAMPAGGSIIVASEQFQGSGLNKFLRITFTDTGSGIAPENISKIFHPFFTTKKGQGGTGLGLSVTKGIVDMHKGSIVVNSQLGKGTSIIINLPL